MKEGTVSSTEAVFINDALPTAIYTDPSAVLMKLGMTLTGRIWSGKRLSER